MQDPSFYYESLFVVTGIFVKSHLFTGTFSLLCLVNVSGLQKQYYIKMMCLLEKQ